MPRVLVPLAEGFEEIEAVSIVDVLRRGGVEVVLAGLAGAGVVRGSHGIAVVADVGLAAVQQERFDLLILPGGEPGVTHLGEDATLRALVQRRARAGQPLAAICAAPRLLARDSLLRGLAATSHPSVAAQVRAGGAVYDDTQPVVRDAHILTSRGPGTALEFALAALTGLGLGDRALELRAAMLVPSAV